MEVYIISITFFKPLQLVFLFENRIFKLEELNVLCIQFMKVCSVGVHTVKDAFFFSIVDLFLIHLDIVEDITKFLLGPITKGSRHPLMFWVKFSHSITFHLLIKASCLNIYGKELSTMKLRNLKYLMCSFSFEAISIRRA